MQVTEWIFFGHVKASEKGHAGHVELEVALTDTALAIAVGGALGPARRAMAPRARDSRAGQRGVVLVVHGDRHRGLPLAAYLRADPVQVARRPRSERTVAAARPSESAALTCHRRSALASSRARLPTPSSEEL